jgi:hypothetical protein
MTTLFITILISSILCLLVFLVVFAVAKETKNSFVIRRAIHQQGQARHNKDAT